MLINYHFGIIYLNIFYNFIKKELHKCNSHIIYR